MFLVFFSLLVVFIQTQSQICTKQVVTTRWQSQSYRYTYRQTYRGQCWYRCIKTKIGTFVDNRLVPRKSVETRQSCCNGYTDVSNTSGSIQCEPICMPACKNGYCATPGICACNDGYETDLENFHSCKPICLYGCDHGTCVAPNVCECDYGYRRDNETCQPICTEVCENGTCIAPDTCVCLPGYRKSEINTCEPYCSSGCPNGECIGPETCTCKDGWIKDENTSSCIPQCEIPCGNGSCIAPDTCECFPGYENSTTYENLTNNTICVPSCSNCLNGYCPTPNECTCEPPLVAKWFLKNGEECDCINNCRNSSVKCDQIMCVIKETETSTTGGSSTSDYTRTISGSDLDDVSGITPVVSTTNAPSPSDSISANDTFLLITAYNTGNKLKTTKQQTSFVRSTSFAEVTTTDYITDSFSINTKNDSKLLMNYQSDNKWSQIWIYVLAIAITLVSLLLIITLVKRNYISKWYKGESYVVEDDNCKGISSSAQTVNMSYKEIMNKAKYEHN